MATPRKGEPFEKRFVELYTVVADAASLDNALGRLTQYTRDTLGASSVKSSLDDDSPRGADDVFSLAEPGADAPWLHLALSWGKKRRPEDSALRSYRASLVLLMPFLAQRRRLDGASEHLEDSAIETLGRPEIELEEPQLRRLLKKLVERAVEEVGGDNGAVLVLEEASGGLTLETSAYVGPLALDPKSLPRTLHRRKSDYRPAGSERRRNPTTSGLFFHVLDTRRPYRSGSVLDDPNYLPLFKESRSNLTMPLIVGGHAVGALIVESSKRDAFRADAEERLAEFAETAAALISKTRAYEETRGLGPSSTLRLFGISTEAIGRAHAAAQHDDPILLRGEPGTGKEMLARYIHRMSERAEDPFVIAADAAAIRTNGAAGGTMFVDNVDHLPQTAQEGIADLIKSGTDIRFVVASSGGKLVDSLAGSLSDIEIVLPPLRLNRDAIAILSRMILREVCEVRGVPMKLLAAPSIEALLQYPFPGNLRELREVIEAAAAAADGPVVQPFHFPPKVLGRGDGGKGTTFDAMQEETERAYLTDLLARTKGDLARAASVAGLEKSKLQSLLKKHKLKAKDFAEV